MAFEEFVDLQVTTEPIRSPHVCVLFESDSDVIAAHASCTAPGNVPHAICFLRGRGVNSGAWYKLDPRRTLPTVIAKNKKPAAYVTLSSLLLIRRESKVVNTHFISVFVRVPISVVAIVAAFCLGFVLVFLSGSAFVFCSTHHHFSTHDHVST